MTERDLPETRVAPIDFSTGFIDPESVTKPTGIFKTAFSFVADKIGPDHWNLGHDPNNAVIQVLHPAFYYDLQRRGGDALPFGYAQRLWAPDIDHTIVPTEARTSHAESDAIVQILRGFVKRTAWASRAADVFANASAPIRDRLVLRNLRGERVTTAATQADHENIQTHYDIGNLLYTGDLGFLDPVHQQYSSGLIPKGARPDTVSLEEMQDAKILEIVRKLDLKDGQKVLEIGTGWGGLAEAILRSADVELTTLTLSHEQAAYAEKRFKEAGFEDRATVLIEHYRDFVKSEAHKGMFDRLVSIEMIEAVDWPYLQEFIDDCTYLTNSQTGRIVLQAILVPDTRYNRYKLRRRGFINDYIFPGGKLHSEAVISSAFAKDGWHMEESTDLTHSYAHTLKHWRDRFNNRFPAVSEIWQRHGVPKEQSEQFHSGWNMYLALSEAGFWEHFILDKQFTFVPKENTNG